MGRQAREEAEIGGKATDLGSRQGSDSRPVVLSAGGAKTKRMARTLSCRGPPVSNPASGPADGNYFFLPFLPFFLSFFFAISASSRMCRARALPARERAAASSR